MCLSRSAVCEHQRLQPRVEHERRDGVDELRLEQLDRRDLGEQEAPRVPVAEVDLLQVLVEVPLGEEMSLIGRLLGEEAHLREVGRARLAASSTASPAASSTGSSSDWSMS